jgi:regulator of protease activity HflC (stomatin/prohibitin superfamily)
MIVGQALTGLSILVWVGLFIYLFYVIGQRTRGRPARFSVTTIVAFVLAAVVLGTLGGSVVIVDAGEVGVVFNVFGGTQKEPLNPGLHFVVPYINTVYRYPTQEQVYTMTKNKGEGEGQYRDVDDSLLAPTIEGLQVGIDSSTRYKINSTMAWKIHNDLRDYKNVLVRPKIRSIVRLYVSQNTVTNVYGPKRAEIQASIETALRQAFEPEGLVLLSFDLRNVDFSEEYARSIEQKQIAQQQAEQLVFVLQKEQREAERKKIEAEGIKQAAITRAQGDAEALRLINQQIAGNPNLILYNYVAKLAPNVSVMLVPSNAPFILSLPNLPTGTITNTSTLAAPTPEPTGSPTPTPMP